MEIFHMRVMQPAVEQCLSQGVYLKDRDTTGLLREIDSLAERAVTAVCGDAAVARVLCHAHRSSPSRCAAGGFPVRGGGRPEESVHAADAGTPVGTEYGVTGLDRQVIKGPENGEISHKSVLFALLSVR
jgi:hypothetical protein